MALASQKRLFPCNLCSVSNFKLICHGKKNTGVTNNDGLVPQHTQYWQTSLKHSHDECN